MLQAALHLSALPLTAPSPYAAAAAAASACLHSCSLIAFLLHLQLPLPPAVEMGELRTFTQWALRKLHVLHRWGQRGCRYGMA